MIVVEEAWQHKIADSVRKQLKGSRLRIIEIEPDDDAALKILAIIRRKSRKRMR
jgi:hypothetical protein